MVALTATDALAQLIPSFGRDRAGTSGYQFLKIPVDARSAAMGQTVASNAFDVSALFWNPALAAQIGRGTTAGVGFTKYHADVDLGYVGVIQDLGSFTFGFAFQTMQSGEMNVTTEFQPFGTGETFQVVDWAAGLTVAQELTDLFSYGLTARFVQEKIAEISAQTLLMDAGIFYRVGQTGAQMAVVIRNFGFDSSVSGEIDRIVLDQTEPLLVDDFESFTPPTTFFLGLSYNAFQSDAAQDLTLSAQLSNPNDNAESFNLGLEYVWHRLFALRSGYQFGVEETNIPSFGLGLMLQDVGPDARFDYGFTSFERLGSVHRISLEVGI
jgi:hypothetical protein